MAGREAAVEAGWGRLLEALRAEVEHIEGLGPHLMPCIEFGDVDDAAQAARFGRDVRRYGVGVVRKVLPRALAGAAAASAPRAPRPRTRPASTASERPPRCAAAPTPTSCAPSAS